VLGKQHRAEHFTGAMQVVEIGPAVSCADRARAAGIEARYPAKMEPNLVVELYSR
jgi:hypothetical protein